MRKTVRIHSWETQFVGNVCQPSDAECGKVLSNILTPCVCDSHNSFVYSNLNIGEKMSVCQKNTHPKAKDISMVFRKNNDVCFSLADRPLSRYYVVLFLRNENFV